MSQRWCSVLAVLLISLSSVADAATLSSPTRLRRLGFAVQLIIGLGSMPAVADTVAGTIDGATDPFVAAEERAIHDPTNKRAQILKASNNWLADSSFLENIRLNSQANVDVTAENKDADVNIYLIPIAKLNLELQETKSSLLRAKVMRGKESQELLERASGLLAPYDVKLLKATFNRYSDNIFYTDKRAANLYLAGGATPSSTQTQAYLYRNSVITSLGNVKQDLKEMISSDLEDAMGDREIVFDDTLDDLKEVTDAMKAYLQLVEPENLRKATDAARTSLSF